MKNARQNTLFTFHWIEKNRSLYQCHLERIADFLVEERVFWKETKQGVMFLDLQEVTAKKKLHHFRSWSIKQELDFVKDCWASCIESADKLIPTLSIKVENDGITSIIPVKSLQFFRENADHQESALRKDLATSHQFV